MANANSQHCACTIYFAFQVDMDVCFETAEKASGCVWGSFFYKETEQKQHNVALLLVNDIKNNPMYPC